MWPCDPKQDPPAQHHGPEFWTDDNLHLPRCGMRVQPTVLIVGAGDGSLQDYIRVITGCHPVTIMEELDDHLKQHAGALWTDVQFHVLASQERAARLNASGYKTGAPKFIQNRDVTIANDLQATFQKQIDRLFESNEKEIGTVLDPKIRNRKKDLPSSVQRRVCFRFHKSDIDIVKM